MRTQRPCKANPYAALRDQVFSASNTRARWTVGHHRSITAGPHLRGAEGVESMSKSSSPKIIDSAMIALTRLWLVRLLVVGCDRRTRPLAWWFNNTARQWTAKIFHRLSPAMRTNPEKMRCAGQHDTGATMRHPKRSACT